MTVVIQKDDAHNPESQQLFHREDMGHSQADKAQSRERILKHAAAQIREEGLESVSVAKLMQAAGLTHGGFYGHFSSRSELLVHALEQALEDGAATFRTANGSDSLSYEAVVRGYLSRSHRDSRAQGCAIAALAGDASRSDQDVRHAMAEHVSEFARSLGECMDSKDEGTALFAISAMIGSLMLSRVLTDPAQSDALLSTAKRELLALRS